MRRRQLWRGAACLGAGVLVSMAMAWVPVCTTSLPYGGRAGRS